MPRAKFAPLRAAVHQRNDAARRVVQRRDSAASCCVVACWPCWPPESLRPPGGEPPRSSRRGSPLRTHEVMATPAKKRCCRYLQQVQVHTAHLGSLHAPSADWPPSPAQHHSSLPHPAPLHSACHRPPAVCEFFFLSLPRRAVGSCRRISRTELGLAPQP